MSTTLNPDALVTGEMDTSIPVVTLSPRDTNLGDFVLSGDSFIHVHYVTKELTWCNSIFPHSSSPMARQRILVLNPL